MEKGHFVIHKHAARHLHYDLRIEIGGVLVSWVLAKGPSNDPSVKRYAVHVTDHPREYRHFEGVIPPGQYGAGPVMIWDTGIFENKKMERGVFVPLSECLKKGVIKLFFRGHKLQGLYALVRMHTEKDWLFIKMKDKYAHKPPYLLRMNRSVATGRTMGEIEQDQ